MNLLIFDTKGWESNYWTGICIMQYFCNSWNCYTNRYSTINVCSWIKILLCHSRREYLCMLIKLFLRIWKVRWSMLYQARIFFLSPSSSSARNLIYVRARSDPSSEIPLLSQPEPSSARISHLLLSPSRAWLGFKNWSLSRARPAQTV